MTPRERIVLMAVVIVLGASLAPRPAWAHPEGSPTATRRTLIADDGGSRATDRQTMALN